MKKRILIIDDEEDMAFALVLQLQAGGYEASAAGDGAEGLKKARKEKPDLIFFDPPYFKKMAKQYTEDSISVLSRKEYMEFYFSITPIFS